ncbi:MAG: CDP-glycerol glycerophosphotransferase family protein [Mogibacterium sp.]|nr:CDP-glycerol glycerophosphotransferase family protein [Mogibacterium sp.]MBQ6501513.1 CDP-glycerol glycerophosphotransferase family protein [Mogibacterium sp.]
MNITKTFKKAVFDIAKKNKTFRRVFRGSRDAAYRAKMTLDDPFGKIDDKLVYFRTFSGRGYSDSPKAMYEYMLTAPEYRDYRFVWCFKEPEKYDFLLKNDRTEIVKFRTMADNKALRRAKYWITNYRMLNHQYPRKGQVYLQCWHGTPLKRLGYDIIESDNAMNSLKEIKEKYRTDARKFSYILSPSPFATEKFATAWNLNETGQRGKIIEKGYPRNDRLAVADEEERTRLRKELGVEDRKVILYAPTWRDNQHTSGQGYTYKTEVDFDKLQKELGSEYIILFRAHYLVANSFDFGRYEGFVKDVSSYPDINDLYIASDILVTDYSSVFFDFSILERPVVFYMYDLDHYANEMRGFYLSIEELPGPIVKTEDDLIAEIRKTEGWTADEKYLEFKKRFNPYEDGNSSKRVLSEVIRES